MHAFAAATTVAAVGGGTATNVVELTIVHCQKERCSTTTTTSISPDNLDLFNLGKIGNITPWPFKILYHTVNLSSF